MFILIYNICSSKHTVCTVWLRMFVMSYSDILSDPNARQERLHQKTCVGSAWRQHSSFDYSVKDFISQLRFASRPSEYMCITDQYSIHGSKLTVVRLPRQVLFYLGQVIFISWLSVGQPKKKSKSNVFFFFLFSPA